MPEMIFTVRWPDDTVSDCYSPSSIIEKYFEAGSSYPLAEFVSRSQRALTHASERVRMKYGYACSSALDQLRKIENNAQHFREIADAQVVVEHIGP